MNENFGVQINFPKITISLNEESTHRKNLDTIISKHILMQTEANFLFTGNEFKPFFLTIANAIFFLHTLSLILQPKLIIDSEIEPIKKSTKGIIEENFFAYLIEQIINSPIKTTNSNNKSQRSIVFHFKRDITELERDSLGRVKEEQDLTRIAEPKQLIAEIYGSPFSKENPFYISFTIGDLLKEENHINLTTFFLKILNSFKPEEVKKQLDAILNELESQNLNQSSEMLQKIFFLRNALTDYLSHNTRNLNTEYSTALNIFFRSLNTERLLKRINSLILPQSPVNLSSMFPQDTQSDKKNISADPYAEEQKFTYRK